MNEIEFYSNLPHLETDQLIIRKFTLEDSDDYFAFASDAEVTKFLRWNTHPNINYTREHVQGILDEYSMGKDSPWGIELKAEKKIIGSIHLMQLNLHHRKAQIGFVFAHHYWNNGYATEALCKIIDYCFTNLCLNRLEAFCIPENRAVMHVMEKVGMHAEGVLRQYQYQKGEFRDFQMLSILKEDYDMH